MARKKPFGLFERYGVEIEYMICHKDTLNVFPIADRLMHSVAGSFCNEFSAGAISYSNELACHVFELKLTEPSVSLENIEQDFQEHVQRLNRLLAAEGACLLPGGMHPWMDPDTEMKLWPHGQNEIYESYHRIFDCTGHGWTNLQSTHLNLSFATDEELFLLHSAIRLLLPIMPALSASSPFVNNTVSGFLDTRLETYRHNQKKIPSIAGCVIPEPIRSRAEYFSQILEPMWQEIAPYDKENILQEEWLNSRGAIVRFDRHAIEIRILDTQECPMMDVAVLIAIVAVLKKLVRRIQEGAITYDGVETAVLADVFLQVVKNGGAVVLTDSKYLSVFGKKTAMTVQALWSDLIEECFGNIPKKFFDHITALVHHGSLASRLLCNWKMMGAKPSYARLRDCLEQGIVYA